MAACLQKYGIHIYISPITVVILVVNVDYIS